MTEWMLFTLMMLFLWRIVYAVKPGVRREMLFVSIYSAPFGFLEPLRLRIPKGILAFLTQSN